MSSTSVFSITCRDGIKLHAKCYREVDSSSSVLEHRILCLHGWMDNINTFWKLAPALVDGLASPAEVVAVDLPGHGRSSHKSLDGPTMLLMDYVYYVHEVMKHLQWEPEDTTLIGHSMGGAVSLMYSAAFSARTLIMLDSLGPYVKEGGAAQHLRTHIKARLGGKDPQSVYDNLDQAVEIRMLTATTFPGKQYISKEAATQLVAGATTTLNDGKAEFQHDQRLKMPSIIYMTQDQVDEIYKAVADSTTRSCLLLAEEGMPFSREMTQHTEVSMAAEVCRKLPGSHHFHADPDSAAGVATSIISFLEAAYPKRFE